MFAMVCLQTSQPDVYNLLVQYPDFTKWDDEIAFKKTQGKEMLEEAFQENYFRPFKVMILMKIGRKHFLKFVIQIQHLEDRQIIFQDFLQF